MTSRFDSRDETIEIREGDYVVACRLATWPGEPAPGPLPRALAPRATAGLASMRTLVAIAFSLGFLATAIVGVVATMMAG
jgi:hypothetical protein